MTGFPLDTAVRTCSCGGAAPGQSPRRRDSPCERGSGVWVTGASGGPALHGGRVGGGGYGTRDTLRQRSNTMPSTMEAGGCSREGPP
uniref:Uncharacterized protein n=1 Tax=Knipowitschia caucasica TaxID=637954 RepID=A0AAV2JL13_KNICA